MTRETLFRHWIEWRSIVDEFLTAVDAMRTLGVIEPIFTFVTETLGEPWDLDRWLVTTDEHLQARQAECDLGDPTLGERRTRVRRHLPLFQWSNPSLENHLALLFTQGVVGQWTIPRITGGDYVEQMTAGLREEREDSRGRIKVLWVQKRRDNHYLVCELMIDAAGIISGSLGSAHSGAEPMADGIVKGSKLRPRPERTVRRPFLEGKSIDLLKSACHVARKPKIVRI